jgi:small subunit ribosomal protein S20
LPAGKTARAQERKRVINRQVRSSSRTAVKKALIAIASAESDVATAVVGKAISGLDRASTKGIIHRNNAARRKSRLAKRLNASLSE